MTRHIFLFWLFILFLSPHGLFSKSLTDKEYTYESANFNAKTDVDQVGMEETAALHDNNFRPRHKYKIDAGHQLRFSRSDTDADKEQEFKAPQCAVMYKNNEPVGILQPFEDSYRFLQVSGEPTLVDINPVPVKRKTIMDVLYPSKIIDDYDNEVVDNTAQFTDDRYPSIFAKFKIDSRLDKSVNSDLHLKRSSMHKRGSEKTNLKEEKAAALKSGLAKAKSDDNVVVEEELKNILDDMGLIDDYPENKEEAKREAEDENLEMGTNKINLVKEEHKEKRSKRDDMLTTVACTATPPTTLPKKNFGLNPAIAPKRDQSEEKHTGEAESIDLFNSNEDAKLEEESENAEAAVSTEKQAIQDESRKKRQNENNKLKEKDSKDDKRNVDSSSANDFPSTASLVKENELSEYEKRVEREIREKIEKLKKEVKKEISELKQTDASKNKESFTEDTRRRKRQVVNTLLDEESVDINPIMNVEEKSQNHVRRKRNATFREKGFETSESVNNALEMTVLKNATHAKIKQKRENTTYTPKKLTSVATENNINSNLQQIIGKSKRFVGINPILQSNKTKYHTRTLELYNENTTALESKPRVRVKRQTYDDKNITIDKRFGNGNISKIKRFVDITPILQNGNNTIYHTRTLKPYNENTTELQDKAHARVKRQIYDDKNITVNKQFNNDNKNNIKRLVGINPVLQNGNHTIYHTRSLKLCNENTAGLEELENKPHVRVKRQTYDDKNTTVVRQFDNDGRNIRRKRQVPEEMEENNYQDDDNSEFGDDMAYENLKTNKQEGIIDNGNVEPNELDRMENNEFTSDSKGCKCDKNSNGCKCGNQKLDLTLPSIKQDDTDYLLDPSNLLEKKSVSQHCNCGKNDNHCKCGHLMDDLSPFKGEYSDYVDEQSTSVKKKSANDKSSLNELQAESKSHAPRRITDRRNFLDRLANEDYNYDTEDNSFGKREAKSRKFSAGRPFKNGEYFVDLHPDIYRLSRNDNSREKRENFGELIAIHGGDPVKRHLVSIRQRSVLPHSRFRRRVQSDEDKQPRQLIDMSDEDLFGALPQSYAGELSRYKRVKRARRKK